MGVTRQTVLRGSVAAAAVLGLSAALVVAPGGPGTQEARAAGLTPFDGCTDLRSWFADAALPSVGPYGLGSGGLAAAGWLSAADGAVASGAREARGGTDMAAVAAAPAAGLDTPVGPGATGTNVQEAGVDEPDLVKSQGDRLVVVRGDRLHVLDASTDAPRALGSLALPSGAAGEVLLAGDRALVLGTSWTGGPVAGPAVNPPPVSGQPVPDQPVPDRPMPDRPVPDQPVPEPALPEPGPVPPDKGTDSEPSVSAADPPVGGVAEVAPPSGSRAPAPMVAPDIAPAGAPTAVLTLVDLSNPEAPAVVRVDEVEGAYVSAREHDGVVRVVLQSTPTLPLVFPTQPGDPADETRTTAENRRLVTQAEAQDWLPQRVVRDASGTPTGTEPLLDCADVRHPPAPAGSGVTTVLTLSLADAAEPTSVAVAADGDLVYASTDRLYVATMRGGWDQTLRSGAAGESPTVRTAVHAFDVSTPEGTTYVASGQVEGWLMGRWAMSEHEGRLRVATTREGPWAGSAETPATDAAVSVLEEVADELSVVGSVGGLGQGEQVRAVRWFGDLATVVTFRQTDPLYTVDLADPTAPRVVGELKVPGYSAYLHPLGDGLLLGVGQDATEEGMTLGTQVSTFDLRDLEAPARLAVVVEPDTYSDVEHDSRQFSYLPELRTALLPLSGTTGSTLWAVRVGDDGSLGETGRWTPGTDGWITRAAPVAGDRLAVLVEGADGSELTLVSAGGLAELGTVPLR